MITLYPTFRVFCTLLTLFTFSLAAKAADDGMGCLLHQMNQDRSTLVSDGYIAQTFDACENGRLEYLNFFVESTDQSTFGVRMSLHHNGEEIHSQQVVIPGKSTTGAVKVWMAAPTRVKASESYEFRLWVPDHKAFIAYHSGSNLYDQGTMKINGLYVGTDLAFEAGVRFAELIETKETPEAEPHCEPRQERTEQTFAVNLIEAQTLSLCNDGSLEGILLYYRATEAVKGTGLLFKRHAESEGPVAVMPFELRSAKGVTPLFLRPELAAELEAGQVYSLSFEGSSGNLPDGFELYCSSSNAYPIGRLHSPVSEESIDLAFQVFLHHGTPKNEPAVHEFTDHPWHDCVISQPYWTERKTYKGRKELSIDLPICDDGNLEAVYLPGKIISNNAIQWKLLRSDGKTLSRGKLEAKERFDEVLTANIGREPSVFYFDHQLVITLAEDDEVQLFMNAKGDPEMPTSIDGDIASEALCYAIGMRPYQIRFEAADTQGGMPEIKAWPNPFDDQFKVRINHLAGRNGMLYLYNLQGVEVFSSSVKAGDEGQAILVRPSIPAEPGFYTLRFEYDDQILLETVVCQ